MDNRMDDSRGLERNVSPEGTLKISDNIIIYIFDREDKGEEIQGREGNQEIFIPFLKAERAVCLLPASNASHLLWEVWLSGMG